MVVLILVCVLLFPSFSHALSFDVSWDLRPIDEAGPIQGGVAFGIDWGESEGAAVNTMTLFDFHWGYRGFPVGDPLFAPERGNLTDGITLPERGIFWQAFVPSPEDPLTFHVTLTENDDPDYSTYGEISMLVWPYNQVCLEPCAIAIGMFSDWDRAQPGHHLWNLFARETQFFSSEGINPVLPAPVLSNVVWGNGPEVTENPEPSTLILMGSGLLLIVLARSHAASYRGGTVLIPPSLPDSPQ
jgi:hypothetical protein